LSVNFSHLIGVLSHCSLHLILTQSSIWEDIDWNVKVCKNIRSNDWSEIQTQSCNTEVDKHMTMAIVNLKKKPQTTFEFMHDTYD
jgi:hypothetical protein